MPLLRSFERTPRAMFSDASYGGQWKDAAVGGATALPGTGWSRNDAVEQELTEFSDGLPPSAVNNFGNRIR